MGKKNKYSAQFKVTVIKFAEEHNNSAAGREFGIYEKLVRDWRKLRNKLSRIPKAKCPARVNVHKYPVLEKKVAEWARDHRHNGYVITRSAIRLHALILARKMGIVNFKASAGWCVGFMRRNSFVLTIIMIYYCYEF